VQAREASLPLSSLRVTDLAPPVFAGAWGVTEMSGVKRQRLDGMGGPGMGGPAWAGVGPGDGYGFDGGMMMMGPGYPQGMGMVPGAFPGAFAGAPMGGMGAPYGEAFDVFPCVKLRGLPFHVGEHDIRGFLVSLPAPARARAPRRRPGPGFA